MKYKIEFKPRATKDLRTINADDARRILAKVRAMENDIAGDIKRLTNFEPQYRLRVGNYRVLFNIENNSIIIYCVKHRREAY
ncbi:MAG: type II toxin-antitoxin system RelE/ParE family toxin [Acidobacteria bacterium]|nr:type II toxin-antitoxin system RelE/ParE family toxin [Acidobacteriota bacterium]MCA1640055.1 type II toxin-antitoxin system RelE/ParE family toxin [Acidobacteriota bacterium]